MCETNRTICGSQPIGIVADKIFKKRDAVSTRFHIARRVHDMKARVPPFSQMAGRFLFVVVAMIGIGSALTACGRYPKDPEGSLKRAKAEKLLVGAINAPPWVVVGENGMTGREVDFVRGFAESLGTRVQWTTGSEEQLMRILQARELHLVVGGITKANPWTKHVGTTNPYYTEKSVVCSREGNKLPANIKGVRVVAELNSSLAADVRRRGGEPVSPDAVTDSADFFATELSRAAHFGCGGGPLLKLATHLHVIAVPKGENALLMAIEGYLNEQGY